MEPDDVRELYGGEYATRYDSLWEESEVWAPEAGHYLRSLGEQIHPGTRWLDVGCGTGWFLSQFPGVERAGVDISPGMLARARAANPDALFLREGDIRDDVPEWHDAWDLVSSTGQAWGYVDSLDQVRQVADNMARWTSPDGVCLVQPGDITDLSGLVIPMNYTGERPPHNTTVITGAIWSYYDEGGVHENQVWPSFDVWVQWFSRHFRRIEIVTWPHDPPFPYLHAPRRLILASAKRRAGDDTPAEIIVHPPPDPPGPAEAAEGPPPPDPDAEPEGAAPEDVEDDAGEDEAHPGDDRSEVAATTPPVTGPEAPPPAAPSAATDPLAHAEPGLPPGRLPGRLVDQRLSYLLGRLTPWDRRFWRSLTKRVRSRR